MTQDQPESSPDNEVEPEVRYSQYNLISGNKLLETVSPERRWVWDGKFASSGLGLLIAKPKVGKTVYGFNAGVNVSRGTPFLGSNTTMGPVIYLGLEEDQEMMKENLKKMGGDFSNIHFHFGRAPEQALEELVERNEG